MLCFVLCRLEEVIVCDILTVWPDTRHHSTEDAENTGTGVCYIQRSEQCNERNAIDAGISVLRKTHGALFPSFCLAFLLISYAIVFKLFRNILFIRIIFVLEFPFYEKPFLF